MTHSADTPRGPGSGGAFGFVRDGYDRAETNDLKTSDLEGATVYGREDESIGRVNSLAVGTDGKISHAVIDVGGFLGMGAHSVQLPFSELTVLRETGGATMRVHLDTTKDKLKAMPHQAG